MPDYGAAKSSAGLSNDGGRSSHGKRRSRFLRYEWFKCKKLGMKWRRPVGLHSKMRQGRKGKPPKVNAGFGHAAARRGMVGGYFPVVVQNVADLARIDREKQAAVLASGLGLRTVAEIVMKAEQCGVVILNKEKIAAAQHRMRVIERQRAERAKAGAQAAGGASGAEAERAPEKEAKPAAKARSEKAPKSEPEPKAESAR
ncbi:MAG: eL32 family ribosomal protein [Candidatus Aenigmatarchaeota archaeon]